MDVNTVSGIAALKRHLDSATGEARTQLVRDILNELKAGTPTQKSHATTIPWGATLEDTVFNLQTYFDNVRYTGDINAPYLAPRSDLDGGRRKRKTRRGRKVRRTRKSRR